MLQSSTTVSTTDLFIVSTALAMKVTSCIISLATMAGNALMIVLLADLISLVVISWPCCILWSQNSVQLVAQGATESEICSVLTVIT
jgi:hypothetical protein